MCRFSFVWRFSPLFLHSIVGFVTTRKCVLSNTSLVPVTYYLHMSNDGVAPSVRSRSPSPAKRSGSVASSAAATHAKLKEFEITPSSGLLPPQSDVEISVELCANAVRKYNTELCVDVEAVQDSLLLLPVTARWLRNTVYRTTRPLLSTVTRNIRRFMKLVIFSLCNNFWVQSLVCLVQSFAYWKLEFFCCSSSVQPWRNVYLYSWHRNGSAASWIWQRTATWLECEHLLAPQWSSLYLINTLNICK